MARLKFTKLFVSEVPLYFLFSSILLVLAAAIALGWTALRAEREGADKVYLGEFAQTIFGAPNLLFSVPQTINTQVKGLNLEIKGTYVAPNAEQFRPLETVNSLRNMDGPTVFSGDNASAGWRIIVGYFKIDEEMLSAAVLLNPELRVQHVWPLHEQDIEHEHKRSALF